MAFSKDGLIDQLEYDGFSNEEALFGVNQIYSDTNLQAQKKAESYLKNIAFSRDGLIKQLEYEGFPHENAVAAVEIVNVDWNEQAAKKAKSYIESMSFSRDDLIRQLEFEGFTHEEAVYGAENYEIVLQNRNNLENSIVVNDSMIKVLIKNLDNLFPIKVMEDFFSNPMVATYSDVGSATAIQTSNQDGYRNIVMFTNSDSVHDYRAVTNLMLGTCKTSISQWIFKLMMFSPAIKAVASSDMLMNPSVLTGQKNLFQPLDYCLVIRLLFLMSKRKLLMLEYKCN
jgi:hypothetical protein